MKQDIWNPSKTQQVSNEAKSNQKLKKVYLEWKAKSKIS